MPRPKKDRFVCCVPEAYYCKPKGIPLCRLMKVSLSLDELEAYRLADQERFSHDQAALRMKVSRATFGRVLREARRKVVTTIIQGNALRIEIPEEKKGE